MSLLSISKFSFQNHYIVSVRNVAERRQIYVTHTWDVTVSLLVHLLITVKFVADIDTIIDCVHVTCRWDIVVFLVHLSIKEYCFDEIVTIIDCIVVFSVRHI